MKILEETISVVSDNIAEGISAESVACEENSDAKEPVNFDDYNFGMDSISQE